MESSSKIYGEECQSSESGWTMYIGSSIDNDDDDDSGGSGGGGGYHRQKTVAEDDGMDTDDSMASDASSGPGKQGVETEEGCAKYNSLNKKYKKVLQQQKKKKGGCEEGRKDDETEVVNDRRTGSVVSTVQSRNSVIFLGRRK